eukprot:s2367_g9.t1
MMFCDEPGLLQFFCGTPSFRHLPDGHFATSPEEVSLSLREVVMDFEVRSDLCDLDLRRARLQQHLRL